MFFLDNRRNRRDKFGQRRADCDKGDRDDSFGDTHISREFAAESYEMLRAADDKRRAENKEDNAFCDVFRLLFFGGQGIRVCAFVGCVSGLGGVAVRIDRSGIRAVVDKFILCRFFFPTMMFSVINTTNTTRRIIDKYAFK